MSTPTISMITAILGILSTGASFAVKPPPVMMANIDSMAVLNATITTCLKSREYKKLAATEALNIHDIKMKAEDLVRSIEEYYGEDAVFLTYQLRTSHYMDLNEFKKDISVRYGNACSPKFLNEAKNAVDSGEVALRKFFLKNPKRQ